jgi:2-phosphoglycolate phosphatase
MRSTTLLIFDLDGTLVDSERALRACMTETLTAFGVNAAAAHARRVAALGPRRVVDDAFAAAALSPAGADEAISQFEAHYARRLMEGCAVYDGVIEVLDHYADRTMIVLTNRPERLVWPLLASLGLARHFAGVYGGDAFTAPKPSPIPVLTACARHGVAPVDAVMIGDSVSDVAAGAAAAARTCAVLYGYGDEAALRGAGPDYLVRDPRELIGMFV